MRAAPAALRLLESAVPAQAQEAAMQTWVKRFVGSLLKQSVERIARVREVGSLSSSCCAVPAFMSWYHGCVRHGSGSTAACWRLWSHTYVHGGLCWPQHLTGCLLAHKTVAGSTRVTRCNGAFASCSCWGCFASCEMMHVLHACFTIHMLHEGLTG